ncbi:2'-5' RNA ligase family protein [Hymenobacter sp. B81]|uniref:2'-5' RNA ligase family protein n=1 Tax=Hymenobacter sp. B81 TaxID=3344878 RepID=UPI0037DDC57D
MNPADPERLPPSLYLLAVLAPEPVRGAVWALKQEVHQRTGSRNAVRLPPHITLLPPFRLLPAAFEPRARPLLARFAASHPAFEVGLRDFAWFGQRTLFVQVTDSAPLRILHAALQDLCRRQLPEVPLEKRPFTPHLTLATRDLPGHLVPALQREFAGRRFQAAFEVRQLTLFRHDGQRWQEIEHFALGAGAAE